jgi:hypothetical protein
VTILAGSQPDDRSTRTAFLERAIQAVDRLAQTVDDSGMRAALETDTDDAILLALGLTQRRPRTNYATAAADPLAAAKARGEQAKRDILAAQGTLLGALDVATLLRIDLAGVERRRQEGRLLALPTESGKLGFPTWQFSAHGLLPGLEEVLHHMRVQSPWMRVQFFLTSDQHLNGRTPLEMLLRGEVEAVKRASAAYGEQLAS